MSYATSDKRIAALKDERKRLISAKQDLERRIDELCAEVEAEKQRNANLRELATHALRHIVEFECEADDREQFQGKPCEWCVYHGSSDCPRIIAVMYGELGIEMPS